MDPIVFLRNISIKIIQQCKNPLFQNFQKSKRLLEEFQEPVDNFERSFFQFKCQEKSLPLLLSLSQNFIAIFLCPIFIFNKHFQNTTKTLPKTKCAVFIADDEPDKIIPESLRKEFNPIFSYKYGGELAFGHSEKTILGKLWKRYWHAPYFIFKCMLKIGMYAFKINIYSPRAIISSCEHSFTSSLLTEYCRSRGVEHINIMHGEKLFDIRDSFVEFDRFYVWDKHYVQLFIKLRADTKQFRVEIPKCFFIQIDKASETPYRFTYYLGAENLKEMQSIRGTLERISDSGRKICVRYHPLYGNDKKTRSVFQNFCIQDPREITFEKSLAQTEYVVSLYSTVLYQAYLSGSKVVIDDVSDPRRYSQLEKLQYIMLKKPHLKLSELLVETARIE